MRFRIDREDERPLYVQIVDEVRSSIILGLLKPGDRLPTVRALAAQLGINLHTVRRAYSVLSEQYVLDVRRGVGSIIRECTNNTSVLERDRLMRELAERALRTANRHGFSAEEMVAGLRRVDMALTPSAWVRPPDPPDAPDGWFQE